MADDNELAPLIQSNIINNFAAWLRDDVLAEPTYTRNQKILIIHSAILSLFASGSAFRLGYKFGGKIQYARHHNFAFLTSYYFGISAYLPVAALSSRSATSVSANLVVSKSQGYNKLMTHRTGFHLAEKLYFFYIILVACLASISDVFNTTTQFYPWIGLTSLLFVIPDILIAPLFNGYYFDCLNKNIHSDISVCIFNRQVLSDESDIMNSRADIIRHLRLKLSRINQLSHQDAQELVNNIVISNTTLYTITQDEVLNKATLLFESNATESTLTETEKYYHTVLRKILGITGALISAIGTFAFFFSLSQGGARAIGSYFEFSKEETEALGVLSSTSVIISKVALAAYSNRASFERYYNLLIQIPSLLGRLVNYFSSRCTHTDAYDISVPHTERITPSRVALYLLTIIIAASSTSSRAELIIEHYGAESSLAQFFIASAIIGTFGTRFWAIDEFINSIISHGSPHKILRNSIEKIIRIIPILSDQQIIAIYDHFFTDNPTEIQEATPRETPTARR